MTPEPPEPPELRDPPDLPDLPDLPELRERDADPRTAAVYEEIRRLGGVPMVALVFRHLATLPGGLDWAWGAIGPAWRTGRLQESAWRIARATPLVPIAPMPPEALAVLGLDEAGLAEVRTVLRAYNRANPENLLSTLCLLRLVDGARASRAVEPRAWTPPVAPGSLPPMVEPASLSPPLAALLRRVAEPGEAGRPRLVQSLYRHLAGRPQVLALAIALLLQRFGDGSIDRGVATLQAAMGAEADAIVPTLSAPPAPHPDVRSALERFGGGVIARMVVVGALLEDALPAGAAVDR
ncbi:MAG TPA: hypothetical protein VEA81_00675 [Burkholderiaceae bacterium]|nr:hypothetical protein [Burkholderiaceae bacterium]